MSDIDAYFSRPEARPVPFWKHPKRAKEAINLIIRALKTTAENVKGQKGIEGDPSLDTNRASRIFFVSGEPGSGKSTLYLTLRAMLSSKGEKTFSEGYRDTTTLNELQGVVRLLDPLDLEVAGDEGENLLAAVLVRLIEVLDKPGSVSNAVLSESCKGAIKELEELATDIGIAWEGNLKARAGELDPDTYSVEVIRTQRARLRVNDRLNNALNEISNHKCYDCNPDTLFVLPVDDFYLKPEASLQLLRLLRMISVPRLFFLVMGDVNTVEALFIEKSLGDWTAVAGPSLFPPLSERLDEALTRARELRARYLRKLLPPAQRETIEAMDWHEALNVEVGVLEQNGAEVEVLQELLLRINLDPPFPETESQIEDLLTFLVSPSLVPLSQTEKQRREKRAKEDEDAEPEAQTEFDLKKVRAAYTALQILDATPREIVDLGSALKEVIRRQQDRERVKKRGDVTVDKDTPLLLSAVRDIVNLVREEHSFLNEKAQEVLGGVLPTRTYSPEDINFQMQRLFLNPSPRPWKEQVKGRLWVRSHRSWDLSVNTSFDELKADKDAAVATDPFGKLPPRPAAWFILLHDLAWKWNPDSLSENLVKRLWDEAKHWEWKPTTSEIVSPTQQESGSQNIASAGGEDAFTQLVLLFRDFVSESNKKQRAEAEQKREPNQSEDFRGWAMLRSQATWKHLPLPKFELFRDLDRFLFIWSKGLESWGRSALGEIDKTLNLWKLAGRIVLLDSYRDFTKEGDGWYEDFAKAGADWFKEFMENGDGAFTEAFEAFRGKRGMSFKYPNEGSEAIKAWRRRLDDWDNQAIEFMKDD